MSSVQAFGRSSFVYSENSGGKGRASASGTGSSSCSRSGGGSSTASDCRFLTYDCSSLRIAALCEEPDFVPAIRANLELDVLTIFKMEARILHFDTSTG